jgi:hypothetical protein
VGAILDPDQPVRTTVEHGLVLVFRTQTGVDAFESTLEDVTSDVQDLATQFVRGYFKNQGLESAVRGLTLVAGRAGLPSYRRPVPCSDFHPVPSHHVLVLVHLCPHSWRCRVSSPTVALARNCPPPDPTTHHPDCGALYQGTGSPAPSKAS